MTSDIAHLADDGSRVQLLSAHLACVAERAARYAEPLGLSRSAEVVGLLHDLGKATHRFQSYLQSFSADYRGRIFLVGGRRVKLLGLLARVQKMPVSFQVVEDGSLLKSSVDYFLKFIDTIEPEQEENQAKTSAQGETHDD